MNDQRIKWICEAVLLSTQGVTEKEINITFQQNGITDLRLVEAGIKIHEYLKSINLI